MSGIPVDERSSRPQLRAASRGRVLTLLALGILLVAAAGVATGVALERRVFSRHEHGRPGEHREGGERRDGGERRAMHERFGRDLGLTPVQAAKIDSIFARHRPAIDSARAESEPKIRAIIDQTRREIDSVLTPEQRTKLHDRMMRERPPGDSSESRGGRPPRFR
jgi:Spy/CpxP family protein refolding chaperone